MTEHEKNFNFLSQCFLQLDVIQWHSFNLQPLFYFVDCLNDFVVHKVCLKHFVGGQDLHPPLVVPHLHDVCVSEDYVGNVSG